MELAEGSEIPLPPLKDLASSDPKLRRATLLNLLTHLSTLPPTSPLTPLQALKIWHTLFYAVYMHDPRISAPLSTQSLLATLTTTLLSTTIPRSNPQLKLALAGAFWETMADKWAGVDRHRVDKVLALMRGVVRAGVGVVYQASEDEGCVDGEKEAAQGQVRVLAEWPLNLGRGAQGRKVPDGIRYHVLDVWVDELERGMQDGEGATGTTEEETPEAVQQKRVRKAEVTKQMMAVVEALSKDGLNKAVRLKAKDVLMDERLERLLGGR